MEKSTILLVIFFGDGELLKVIRDLQLGNHIYKKVTLNHLDVDVL